MNPILTKLRFRDWWDSKIPPLLALQYLGIAYSGYSFSISIAFILCLLLWSFAAAGFGHYINDCFDIRQDSLAGKQNRAQSNSLGGRILISISLACMAFLPWIYLGNNFALILTASHLLLFLMYSMPPVRLKEKGVWGIITDSLYAHVIPVLIVFVSLNKGSNSNPIQYDSISIVFWISWSFIFGIRGILSHQVQDFAMDQKSGTKSFVHAFQKETIGKSVLFFWGPLELILFIFASLRYSSDFQSIAFVFFIFICFKLYLQFRIWKKPVKKNQGIPFLNSLQNNFYEQVWPLSVLCLLMLKDRNFIFLVAIHLLVFPQTIKHFSRQISDIYRHSLSR